MNKRERWITTILSTFTMALLMSGVITGIRLGVLDLVWLQVWGESFLLAWPVALLASVVLLPQVRRFSLWLCASY